MPTTDYHDFTSKDTPRAERDALYVGGIWINAATCGGCGDYVRSRNKHDFRTCSCGGVSVDGGSHYARRSFKDDVPFENHIEYFDDVPA